MVADWQEYRIEEIALDIPHAMSTGPFGSAISSKFFQDEGVPVIRGGNLSTDVSEHMSDNGLVFISSEKAQEFQRSIVRPGDLVFTCWGTINQVGLITEELKYSEYIISNKQMKLTPDPKMADSLFLYYLFSSPIKQSEILSNGIGAAVPGFNLGQLKKHVVRLPNITEQRRIAKVLGAFDLKIRHNNKTNLILEEIAQAIFKSWFVNFEPVKVKIEAKANGQDPERAAMCAISGKTDAKLDQLSPDQLTQLRTTAALFPDEFTFSELGPIPKGWEKQPLSEMIRLIGGGTPKRSIPEYWSGEIPWFSVQDAPADGDVFVLNTQEKITQFGLDNSSTRLLPTGTTIISARGTVGRLALTGVEMAMNQSCYGVMGANGIGQYFNFFSLKNAVGALKQNTHGAVFDTITRKTFETVPCMKPTLAILNVFEMTVSPLMSNIRNNLHEGYTLTQLRDTLLPRLLSGEITIDNAQEAIKEAV